MFLGYNSASQIKILFVCEVLPICKHIHKTTDLQVRLSEQVFVHNNTMGPGKWYTPYQLVVDIISSGVPGIYQVPESDSSKFTESLKRNKAGINKSKAKQPHSTLGDSLSYEPGGVIHFLSPRGTSVSEWKFIIASAFKFKLLRQPAGQKLVAPGGYFYHQVYSGLVLQFLD